MRRTRAQEVEVVGLRCRCIEKTAEASKSAAFVDGERSRYVSEGRDSGREQLGKACFPPRGISVKIRITGLAKAGSAAGRIQVSRRRGPPTGFRLGWPGRALDYGADSAQAHVRNRVGERVAMKIRPFPCWGSNLQDLCVTGRLQWIACVVFLRALRGLRVFFRVFGGDGLGRWYADGPCGRLGLLSV